MSKDIQCKVRNAAFKSWLGIAGLWGAGLLPCPGCGAPMLFHFWPLALALTLAKLRRDKQPENAACPSTDAPALNPEVDHVETP